MIEDKNKLIEKLKRLMSMTTEAGASEQEALIAAEKAAALMAEHNVHYQTVADIEAESFTEDKRSWFKGWKDRRTRRSPPLPPVNLLLFDISDLCSVEHWFNRYSGELAFFGAAHDTAIAHYLTDILNRAMLLEWKAYSARRSKSSRASFMQGMAYRLSRRLHEMAKQSRASTATGTGLVLVKNALVKQRFKDAHPVLQKTRSASAPSDAAAVLAGLDAGGRVALSKGVNDATGAKLIAAVTEVAQ